MLSVDPLASHRLSKEAADVSSKQSGRCALHLVAQYSESLELLQDVLRIDHKMTKMDSESEKTRKETTPLGFLCSRPHFPTFDDMVLCLIGVDSSVEIVSDV
jgi:hypothetical protein